MPYQTETLECSKCGKDFTPGINGIVNPILCDSCAGIERDSQGWAWSTKDHNFLILLDGGHHEE